MSSSSSIRPFTQRHAEKFREKLSGEIDVEAVLQRLDVFTEDEARATAGQTLEVVYGLLQMMRAAMDGEQTLLG